MGYLGTPYRVAYEAKRLTTGLTDIVGLVRKPNGALAGPYPFVEMAAPFQGRYYFDFYSSPTGDPQGEYVTMIVSPTEGIQTSWKMPLYNDPAYALANELADEIAALNATIATLQNLINVVGGAIASATVVGYVSDTIYLEQEIEGCP